jgi:hypothetical protein
MVSDERTAIVESLGALQGQMWSLDFNGYGSLHPDGLGGSVLGPLVDPIHCLHRDFTLQDAGPWARNESCAYLCALANRELQWLTSVRGEQLFKLWRQDMYPEESTVQNLEAFTQLAESILEIIPQMYTLFPVPPEACRPVLSHADFHYSNILVSHENPTLVTGVIDWECTSIVPLWQVYSVPSKIKDYGDKQETDPEYRKGKQRLRNVFARATVKSCPQAAIVALSEDNKIQRSIRGLCTLYHIATSGVALYSSRGKVKSQLEEMEQYILDVNNTKGAAAFRKLVYLFA